MLSLSENEVLWLTWGEEDAIVVIDSASTDKTARCTELVRLDEMETRESLMWGYEDVLDDKAVEATTVFDRIPPIFVAYPVHRL